MGVEAEIIVKLKLGDDTYDVNLAIPSGPPSAENLYKFNVAAKTAEAATSSDLLTVVVGGSEMFYVKVSPPQLVLDMTDGIVEDLEVVVNDGEYDPKTGLFKPA